jgi:hypothetical protein
MKRAVVTAPLAVPSRNNVPLLARNASGCSSSPKLGVNCSQTSGPASGEDVGDHCPH